MYAVEAPLVPEALTIADLDTRLVVGIYTYLRDRLRLDKNISDLDNGDLGLLT